MLRLFLTIVFVCTALAAQQERWTLRGRVVADEDGRPLAGATVTLTGHQATGYPLHWAWLDWFDPAPVITGADGAFSFSLPAQPDRAYGDGWPSRAEIFVTTPGRMAAFGNWHLSKCFDDPNQNVGDVRLPRGREARVRLRDRTGAALPGVVVHVEPEPTPASPPHWYWVVRRSDSVPTDDNGVAATRGVLSSGAWRFLVPGAAPADDAHVTVDSVDGPPLDIALVADPPKRTIAEGRVLDEANQPCGDFELVAMPQGKDGGPDVWLRTKADGTFRIGLPAGVESFSLREVEDDYSRSGRWGAFRANDLRISIRAARRTSLRMKLQIPSGIAAERITVHAIPRQPQAGARILRRVLPVIDGTAVLEGLAPVPYSLRVHVIASRLWPSRWLHCEAAEQASEPFVVRFEAPTERTLFVFTNEGRPVVDGVVELVHGSSAELTEARSREDGRWTHLVHDRTMIAPDTRDDALGTLADRGRTDSSGRVRLRSLPRTGPVCVCVRGGGAADTLIELASWQASNDVLRVTAPGAGELRGVVRGEAQTAKLQVDERHVRSALECGQGSNPWRKGLADLRLECGSIVLLRRVGNPNGFERRTTWGDDGRFSFDAVEPGLWDLVIVDREVGADGGRRDVERPGLGARAEVVAGEVREVELAPRAEPTKR